LERQIDEAARRFAETREQKYKLEVEQLASELVDLDHLAVLDDALHRCRGEDMRTPDVHAALEIENEEGRWQNLNASLNGIRRAVNL